MSILESVLILLVVVLAVAVVALWFLFSEAARALSIMVAQLRAGGPVWVAPPGQAGADPMADREGYLVARLHTIDQPDDPAPAEPGRPILKTIRTGPGGQAVPLDRNTDPGQ